PLLGVPPIPVICSIILTLDFPLLEAEAPKKKKKKKLGRGCKTPLKKFLFRYRTIEEEYTSRSPTQTLHQY
ncbi:hypothetical protein L208DRAFT_1279746, partial [Tricholoma matsutake]